MIGDLTGSTGLAKTLKDPLPSSWQQVVVTIVACRDFANLGVEITVRFHDDTVRSCQTPCGIALATRQQTSYQADNPAARGHREICSAADTIPTAKFTFSLCLDYPPQCSHGLFLP